MADTVLLTGATGFVGRRLLPRLEADGSRVICTSRDPERAQHSLQDREVRRLEVSDAASIRAAMEGCDVAYYLVHSMRDASNYDELEARAAEAFARSAAEAGLQRIIYLGGVEPAGRGSRHLQSRIRTGEILRQGSVRTLELRAAMIIGGGSESWRIVRDLAARLPLMIFPRWLDSRSEPVSIDDVTAALEHARRVHLPRSAVFDLPGPERLSACDVILRTSHLLGTHPRVMRVPVVTPKLSGYWIRLVTRADPRVAAALIEGLRADLLSRGDAFWRQMPDHTLLSFDEAATIALREEAATLPARSRRVEAVMRRLWPTWVSAER